MKFLYDLSIKIYDLLILLANWAGNEKAGSIASGRKETIDRIKRFRKDCNGDVAWFHCASLGEFEQARPVIESIKQTYSNYKIVVSFYSPSGYEVRKNSSFADLIVYLPSDTNSHATEFIAELKPTLAFFIKYEFWLNFLDAIQKASIPLFLVSGVFRKNLWFFRSGGNFMRRRLNAFTHFFLQEYTSGELLTTIGIRNWTVSGDTRFDRVQKTAQSVVQIDAIISFKQDKPLLVIGSCWKEDMHVLIPFINAFQFPLKIVIAPHEIHTDEIKQFQSLLIKKSVLYSAYTTNPETEADILFIDNIGMLSSIYAYADYAYVGGAFGSGLHNILEPAVFGPPVFFGPNIQKFKEAGWMISLGYGFSISNTGEFTTIFQKIYNDPMLKSTISTGLQNTMLQACGATEHIMNTLSGLSIMAPSQQTPTHL
ncbi:MAG: 3-deoxy-D-manno-octulosonic acid transferase [Cytophagales bacterium]|nr:3-deoxy-D-manno-octulosonic acid transferase [Cytophaga sp.]